MDEILWCYHSNETSSAALSHGTIYLVCCSNFCVCGYTSVMLPFKWNLLIRTFTWGKIKGPTTLRLEVPGYVIHGKRVKTMVSGLQLPFVFNFVLLWKYITLPHLPTTEQKDNLLPPKTKTTQDCFTTAICCRFNFCFFVNYYS